MSKTTMFERWVKDPSEIKVRLLARLEKNARLIAHVKDLTGDTDERLVRALIETSKELQSAYSDTPK